MKEEKNVRALSVRNTQKNLPNCAPKEKHGITLIALIITIIVLLILAMVSIKLIWNGGIIDHAKNATSKYTIEQEKELIGLGYSSYKMAKVNDSSATLTVEKASVTGENPWTITFNGTGNVYSLKENGEIEGPTEKQEDIQYEVPEDLETYVLGTEKTGQDIFNIMSIEGDTENPVYKFKSLNGKEVQLFNIDSEAYEFYIKYDNRGYAIKLEMEGENLITKELSVVYVPKGKEGQKVTYSYDGTKENEKEWTILYDNGSNVEIVSPDTVGDELRLGKNDTSDYLKSIKSCIKSYNEAISEINNGCSSIVKNSNKIKVRSTGSDPVNPDNENFEIVEEYNGEKIRGADENYKKDVLRLSYYGILNTSNNKSYWLASRNVRKGSYSGNVYGVWCVVNGQYDIGGLLTDRPSNMYDAWSKSYAIRPIVKVNASSVEVIK